MKHIKVWHLVFGFLIASFLGLNIGLSCLNSNTDSKLEKETWVEKCAKDSVYFCNEGQSIKAGTCLSEIYADRYIRCSNTFDTTH